MERLPVDNVEKCIGILAPNWVNNCHLIASLAINAGCYTGAARYGMYMGDVDDECPVRDFIEKYEDRIPIRHGWIEKPDGSIVDPTRWVFEGEDPYIALITEDDWEHDDYDPGMQRFKKQFSQPCPERDDPRPNFSKLATEFTPKGELLDWVIDITGDEQGYPFTTGQALWLANLLIADLDGHGPQLYQALEKAGLRAFIPTDHWSMVMGPKLRKLRNPIPTNYRPPANYYDNAEDLFYHGLGNFYSGVKFAKRGLGVYAATRLMNAAFYFKETLTFYKSKALAEVVARLWEIAEKINDHNIDKLAPQIKKATYPLQVIIMNKMPQFQHNLNSITALL